MDFLGWLKKSLEISKHLDTWKWDKNETKMRQGNSTKIQQKFLSKNRAKIEQNLTEAFDKNLEMQQKFNRNFIQNLT